MVVAGVLGGRVQCSQFRVGKMAARTVHSRKVRSRRGPREALAWIVLKSVEPR